MVRTIIVDDPTVPIRDKKGGGTHMSDLGRTMIVCISVVRQPGENARRLSGRCWLGAKWNLSS
jgi:hypothetical protein